ncbi:uncharacterized protein N7511_007441 [Penicillium nucicola]|uniref:uncharacterized protein n=1 Tax=Penicillium nucicola TaxID=1850975 RepID=UPI002545B240|nr:uncharacterized protein N7511_007441 [Penicillium nucicola]KAJ5757259.1 hypothetical protein N7511_007441 [Penicillium nucicola]
MAPFRIVIVGGGIAGFTAAIALRGPNRQITILEQSALNKEIGALISLQPNASRIVECEWSLSEELSQARQMVDEGFRIYNTEGQLVNTVPLRTKEKYGAERLLFHRRDLHDAFKRAAVSPTRAGDPVTVRVTSRVVDCDVLKGTVTLDGGEVIEGDLIVGADGIHSVLRKHVLEEAISPMPTGHSAYRLMMPTEILEKQEPEFCAHINPREPFTSMIVAHNCRLIMGPGRQGEVYGIVALVPDGASGLIDFQYQANLKKDQMNEDPHAKQSWVAEGNFEKMMDTFANFPSWVKNIFKHSADLGLWQLRDLSHLKTWHRGRVIIIGDAAHAMLPTQGQGASQAIEDSEALGAFLKDILEAPSPDVLTTILEEIFKTRYERASLIQAYSRQAAKPATAEGNNVVTMKPDEFMDFNCGYRGAKEWKQLRQYVDLIAEMSSSDTKQSTKKMPTPARKHLVAPETEQLRPATLRCQSKQIECVSKRSQLQNQNNAPVSRFSPINTTPDSSLSDFSVPPATEYSDGHEIYDANFAQDLTLDQFLPSTVPVYPDLNNFPAFFEQVMLPNVELEIQQETQQPRGVFDFMLDTDFVFPENDLFDTNFMPDLDRLLDTGPSICGSDDLQNPQLGDHESASRRAAAFRKSFWLWVPEKNQHAFSEERRIPLRDGDTISPNHRNRLQALQIPGKLSMHSRDDILKLVVRTAGSRLSVSSFPSAEYLDTLIKVGIGKRTETDAWIHPYTFYDQKLRPELLTGLVAAGCVEDDNSVLRDLQWLQASMLWLDIGIFCGYRRKMQIAESYLQPLCTAFRRAAAFDRSTYSNVTPYIAGDDEQSLNTVWHEWVRQESLKRSRLAYHLFGHDVEVAMAMNRPALTSYTELTLPFPAARDLWLAPTATAWRDLWNTKYRIAEISDFSLRDLLSDPSLITHIPVEMDFDSARTALLQGMASQVWETRQQMVLSQGSRPDTRAMTRLWLQSRQDDLYTTLKSIPENPSLPPPVTLLLNEFVMMYLHVDIDAIQRFVGKLGELDARRAYPGLRDWSHTKEARTSIWHAGQTLRAARTVKSHQLRGFDAMAIYHAVLVLWVYGLLQCGELKQLEAKTPMSEAELPPCVSLDGPEDMATKAFLGHGIGRPGLTMTRSGPGGDTSIFCELSKPRSIMAVARQVLKGNCPCPVPEDRLPPMIQNLCELIEDLGNLP